MTRRRPSKTNAKFSKPATGSVRRPKAATSIQSSVKPCETTTSTEGCLLEENLPKILPLRNGTEIEPRLALSFLDVLRNLSVDQPHHFQVLLAIGQGQEVNDPTSIKFLQDAGFLLTDRSINPNLRNVLVSAYQMTPEGPVLTNPFKLTDLADARALEQFVERRFDRE